MEPLPTRTLGQKIREMRESASLSLRALGDQLRETPTSNPVSAAFLSDIEGGRRFPSDEMIVRIAGVFACDPEDLRKCDPRPPIREIQDLATMNPQYAFAFRRVAQLAQRLGISPEEIVRGVEGTVAANVPGDQGFQAAGEGGGVGGAAEIAEAIARDFDDPVPEPAFAQAAAPRRRQSLLEIAGPRDTDPPTPNPFAGIDPSEFHL